ncbi:aminoglycoside phosphotransferase family protein [Sporosalibacterium faouarense]|uniref:aminoglycoside phosphotransferase family protein n=1 Tax=Sporosalibacterium faouarense TaxID=516123 RepID=UPI00192B5B73|nr:aminoglycoside phosphotransferase family protein [Sporosalibacterium faouarense]
MIFKVKEFINPSVDEKKIITEEIKNILIDEYEMLITEVKEIEDGQNLNYFMRGFLINKKEEIKLLVKILLKSGYPDVVTLNKCYELLNSAGFNYYKIIHSDESNKIAPYGFIIQKWIDGEVKIFNEEVSLKMDPKEEISWIKDYALLLKQIHSIKLNYFGDIKGQNKFSSIHEYYENIDEVIRWSFGNVKDGGVKVNELVNHEVLEEEFLKYVSNKINDLCKGIKGPKESVLIYGDMFPSNIVYEGDEPRIIDWDECRANWWVYEIARTTYYIEDKYIGMKFIEYYKPNESIEEIDIGIRIEHVKQHLRKLCIMCMNSDKNQDLMDKVEGIKEKIINRLESSFLFDKISI